VQVADRDPLGEQQLEHRLEARIGDLRRADLVEQEVRRGGFEPIDGASVLLTHLSEVIRNNLPQFLSYKDMRALLDRLDPEYKRLLDEICPSQISYSGSAGPCASGRARRSARPGAHAG
jgi:type III secretory pathway component EscV